MPYRAAARSTTAASRQVAPLPPELSGAVRRARPSDSSRSVSVGSAASRGVYCRQVGRVIGEDLVDEGGEVGVRLGRVARRVPSPWGRSPRSISLVPRPSDTRALQQGEPERVRVPPRSGVGGKVRSLRYISLELGAEYLHHGRRDLSVVPCLEGPGNGQ